MSDYLDRLIAGSRGQSMAIRPRPAARFEPVGPPVESALFDAEAGPEMTVEVSAGSRPVSPGGDRADPPGASPPPSPRAEAASTPTYRDESSGVESNADSAEPEAVETALPAARPARAAVQTVVDATVAAASGLVVPGPSVTTVSNVAPATVPGNPVVSTPRPAAANVAATPTDRPAESIAASAEHNPRPAAWPGEPFDAVEATRTAAWIEASPTPDAWAPSRPTTRIVVSIGRIEVHAPAAPPAPARPRQPATRRGPAVSLDDYLRRRNGSGR